jgi:hypothetical protein
VKRLSLVTHPEADRVENLEGNSRRPKRRWSLETPAGSKSTAWAEREASRQLGDPPSSWFGNCGPSISTEWANPEGDKQDGGRWKSDPLVVLGARESRAHGEAAGQVELLVQGNIACTLRGRKRMSTQLDQIAK